MHYNGVSVVAVFRFSRAQRTIQIMTNITKNTTRNGNINDKIESTTAPIHSPVLTTGFATPPVVSVEAPRNATVLNWTALAVPPPTIIADAQVANWDISPELTARVDSVPAIIAAGVAILSNALSTHGM